MAARSSRRSCARGWQSAFQFRQFFAEEGVENGAGGVEGLKLVLHVQSGEDVLGVAYGQVGGVGVIRRVTGVLGSGDDIGIQCHVMLGQPVGGGFRRGGFQVVQVSVLFLVILQPFPHVGQHFFGGRPGFPGGSGLSGASWR